ncbi:MULTISPECIES: hypothetical protein, partial [unclassified Bradyrhizobium]|uniref:hypothetical protein n=1 Tax=unclassified Bradyrhizobium TaxID=2631580 RepID=UPI0005561DA8
MLAGISIERTGSKDTGICDCCGRTSRTVWGLASNETQGLAAYYVHWTLGHISDQGANIDLIVGNWGKGTTAADRCAVALAYRLLDTGPAMMVIDAGPRSFSRSPLIGKVFARDEVVGTPFAQQIFSIADAVLAQDDRIAELLG